MTPSVRAEAARALAPVLAGKGSLATTLPTAQAAVLPRDRGLLMELTQGTARWTPWLRKLLADLVDRAPSDPQVEALLLVGAYQLLFTRIPDHAAIGETVAAARTLHKDKLTGFINGVLRRLQREQDALCAKHEDQRHAHPDWLLARLQTDWPRQWPAIVEANNTPGPMTLRVNRRQGNRDAYLLQLQATEQQASPCAFASDGLTLAEPTDVTQLPGFADGACSVQDEATQLAADLLALRDGLRVLDACAAPGGKSAHILEQADVQLTALENDPARAGRITETLARLHLTAEVTIADASTPADWWDGQAYDRILLDAPCSGTGVIRRHPDIKLTRRSKDIAPTVRLQAALLDALWPLLAPGGRLVYGTCSLLKAENEDQIAAFLSRQADAQAVTLDVPWGEARPVGRQLLPQPGGHDGFYYAVLEKTAD